MSPKLPRYLETVSVALGIIAALGVLAGPMLVNGRMPWSVCMAGLIWSAVSPLPALAMFASLIISGFAGVPACGDRFEP